MLLFDLITSIEQLLPLCCVLQTSKSHRL